MPATLRRITIYPIKSLDSLELDKARVLPCGGLADDRRFALIDTEGHFINGKRTAAVHGIRAAFDPATMTVQLRSTRETQTAEFSLVREQHAIGEWFSAALATVCNFAENHDLGFPDDTDAPGPTLVSTATLETVASWFPGLSLDEVRRRFRANLEIDGVEPFWEDRLVGPPGTELLFRIGDVNWLGVTVCQRCVVPTRDSGTGEATPLFQKSLATHREASLPPSAPRERFDHFYRLAINTRLAPGQAAGRLRVGDVVRPD